MIYPVILCGGSGTRLWPLSRKSYPKQFAELTGKNSLFQETARRLTAEGYAPPTILTGSDFRFIITEQLTQIGIDPGAVLIEPEGRNTAPAVLAAALFLLKKDPDALLLVAPSDHVIPDAKSFQSAVEAGKQAAHAGDLVTFGIVPDRAETGYGYLELAGQQNGNAPVKLKRFVEKPNIETAKSMLSSGNFLWNAGIFLFSAKAIIEAFETHTPDLLPPVRDAVEFAETDLGFLRLAPEPWAKADNISIDYAVMERANNLSVVPFGAGWSDLGDWYAVWREENPDNNGVICSGTATAIECTNSLLRSESPDLELVGIGLDNIVAIAMPDAVLVIDKTRTQDVKLAVEALKSKDAAQAQQFPRDHRPWGWVDNLAVGERFKVKRITLNPGKMISLQSHSHRSEHWVVVEGTALVTIENEETLLTENQSTYIPLGKVHGLKNPGKIPVILIEIQAGHYLNEDDIKRHKG